MVPEATSLIRNGLKTGAPAAKQRDAAVRVFLSKYPPRCPTPRGSNSLLQVCQRRDLNCGDPLFSDGCSAHGKYPSQLSGGTQQRPAARSNTTFDLVLAAQTVIDFFVFRFQFEPRSLGLHLQHRTEIDVPIAIAHHALHYLAGERRQGLGHTQISASL
jgi:hypothetical protein